MSEEFNRITPMAQRVYRLRLCESLHREIVSRSTRYAGSKASEGSAGKEVEDMLRLKDDLPILKSEEEAALVHRQIEAALASCQSEVVRGIPPANIAHFMRMAYRESKQPYVPTADELPLGE